MGKAKAKDFESGFFKRKVKSPEDIKRFSEAFGSGDVREYELKAIDIINIELPKDQPRKYFDEEALHTLSESIKVHGVIEPLVVRPLDSDGRRYELIAGERRLRASVKAGLVRVPVAVQNVTEKQATELALIENLQREDLNPVEETEAILKLLAINLEVSALDVPMILYRMKNAQERKNKVEDMRNNVILKQIQTVTDLFNRLGGMTWLAFTTNRLPLLNLPENISLAMRAGKIAYTKALEIAKIEDKKIRTELLEEAISKKLSVKEIKRRVKETLQPTSPKGRITPSKGSLRKVFQQLTDKIDRYKLWDNEDACQIVKGALDQLNDRYQQN